MTYLESGRKKPTAARAAEALRGAPPRPARRLSSWTGGLELVQDLVTGAAALLVDAHLFLAFGAAAEAVPPHTLLTWPFRHDDLLLRNALPRLWEGWVRTRQKKGF
jgi:hypothetical protein